MNKPKPNFHKQSDQMWINEAGDSIPVSMITTMDKRREVALKKVYRAVEKAYAALVEVDDVVNEQHQYIIDTMQKLENTPPPVKGNITHKNFDGSFKFSIRIQRPREFDELKLNSAKALFDEVFAENMTSSIDFLNDLVKSAFSSSNGNIDKNKLLDILKYENAKNAPDKYNQGCQQIRKAMHRPNTKQYSQFAVRNERGAYEALQLALSKV